jgi:hypothetical protein
MSSRAWQRCLPYFGLFQTPPNLSLTSRRPCSIIGPTTRVLPLKTPGVASQAWPGAPHARFLGTKFFFGFLRPTVNVECTGPKDVVRMENDCSLGFTAQKERVSRTRSKEVWVSWSAWPGRPERCVCHMVIVMVMAGFVVATWRRVCGSTEANCLPLISLTDLLRIYSSLTSMHLSLSLSLLFGMKYPGGGRDTIKSILLDRL